MTRDEVLALFARRQDARTRLDWSALTDNYAEDAVVESPLAGGTAVGREAIDKIHATFFGAFTDMKFQPEDLLIDGDRVAEFLSASGTDNGGLLGMAPTGRRASFRMAILYRLRDGLISHERRVYDFTGVLVQVGAIKAKPV